MSPGQWFTVTVSAEEPRRRAVCQEVLRTLWPTLACFDMDLAGLGSDVVEKDAVEQLRPYRARKPLSHQPSEIVRMTPGRDDTAVEAVMHLATRTVGSTGLAAAVAEIVYDVNDAGTSFAFRLTAAQFVDIEDGLKRRGLPPGLLVPLRQTPWP